MIVKFQLEYHNHINSVQIRMLWAVGPETDGEKMSCKSTEIFMCDTSEWLNELWTRLHWNCNLVRDTKYHSILWDEFFYWSHSNSSNLPYTSWKRISSKNVCYRLGKVDFLLKFSTINKEHLNAWERKYQI